MTNNSTYKHPGVLLSIAEFEWEWYKTFGYPSLGSRSTLSDIIRIRTRKYGINHQRYFNIVWGHIEELWLEDVKREFGVI